jgi:ABC-type cobalamin transport system permease subunit
MKWLTLNRFGISETALMCGANKEQIADSRAAEGRAVLLSAKKWMVGFSAARRGYISILGIVAALFTHIFVKTRILGLQLDETNETNARYFHSQVK